MKQASHTGVVRRCLNSRHVTHELTVPTYTISTSSIFFTQISLRSDTTAQWDSSAHSMHVLTGQQHSRVTSDYFLEASSSWRTPPCIRGRPCDQRSVRTPTVNLPHSIIFSVEKIYITCLFFLLHLHIKKHSHVHNTYHFLFII